MVLSAYLQPMEQFSVPEFRTTTLRGWIVGWEVADSDIAGHSCVKALSSSLLWHRVDAVRWLCYDTCCVQGGAEISACFH